MVLLKVSMEHIWGAIRTAQIIFLSCLISLKYISIELATYFSISGEFARLDVLSLEDWFSNTFNFKETGPITQNFETMGSDNKIMLTNSGSFFGMQTLIFVRVIILTIFSLLVRSFTRLRIARLIGMRIRIDAPLASIQNQSSKLLLELYFEVCIAVFIQIQGWRECQSQVDFV
jgi:hypothetical protein